MGIFGKSKEDMTQDEQLKQIWKWIDALNKNQAILIKNNNVFIQNEKSQRKFNADTTKSISALIVKDRQHDQKDQEHDALIENLKNLGKALETAEVTSSVT